MIEFTDDNFEIEVLDSDQPVLVDFWSEWCPPCRALAPTIEELARDYAGKAKVGKLNSEHNQGTSVSYEVMHLPTVLIFKGGEVVNKFVGLTGKKDLATALDEALS